ncbi:MAG: glutathione S-transferase family protein [Myxococcota bacterium]|nr:glutathione S-transferase family protein [Myxococcota bacterium]
MKLHDFAFSPNCRKVRALAYELRIELEFIPVDLSKGAQRSPAFLAINPNGRVPVLVDGDLVLWESTAILRYLAGKAGSALVPAAPYAQAEVDRWLSWQLAHLGPAMSKVVFERIVKKVAGQGAPDETAIAAGTAEFAKLTAILDNALVGREYLAGALSIADFALASHFSLAETGGLDLGPYAHVNAWLSRVLARDSMRRALADAQAAMGSNAA